MILIEVFYVIIYNIVSFMRLLGKPIIRKIQMRITLSVFGWSYFFT